jgi:hypothetical protein
MGCDYCPQGVHVANYVKRSRVTTMEYADFVQMLSTVPKDVEIVFAGMAEPWLNASCTNMVLHAFQEGYKVGVYTTGAGMRLSDVEYIKSLPFSFFALHLPDAHGRMKMIITEQYLRVLGELIKMPHSCMVIGELHPEVEKITGLVEDNSDGLLSRAGLIKTLAIPRKSGVLHCSACGPKIDHNILLPNGDVLLCCMDYAQKHVIGNLLKMEYSDLFHSSEYMRVMDGLKNEGEIICRYCEISKN